MTASAQARGVPGAAAAQFAALPEGASCVLRGGRIPRAFVDATLHGAADAQGFVQADVLIHAGSIATVGAPVPAGVAVVDLDGGQLWPGCAELHTHMDKGHIVARAPNPDGTLPSAVEAVRRDRLANWTAADVERRFDFSLRCAYAHGTVAIRSHIDSYHPQAPISWPAFTRLRAAWAGRIDLQGVAMTMLNVYETDEGRQLADLVAAAGGILGGVTRIAGPPSEQKPERIAAALDRLLRLARERDLAVDLHVDETAELEPNTLREVARAVLRNRFTRQVVCGHCCSLALQPSEQVAQTMALVREAGIAVVSLPLVNQHLQGRQAGATPRWRGVTLLRELAAAGIPVAASSDNCRDPMYTYGDFDAFEVFRDTVKICQLDPDTVDWVQLVTATPARIMELPTRGRIAAGLPADLIAFRGRSMSELIARPQHDRLVIRAGRPIDTTPPDHRELDA